MFSPLRRAPVDGVAADGERLDQGELLQRELGGRVELARRHDEAGAHAAVGVDAEDLEVPAAVAAARAAGVARLAVHVRLDGAAVAGLDVRHALPYRDDLHAQLVARDARVAVKRHLPQVAADVAAADADAVHAHDGVAGPGRRRLVDVNAIEAEGMFQKDGFHRLVPTADAGALVIAAGRRRVHGDGYPGCLGLMLRRS